MTVEKFCRKVSSKLFRSKLELYLRKTQLFLAVQVKLLPLVSLYIMQMKADTSYPKLERHFFPLWWKKETKAGAKITCLGSWGTLVAFTIRLIRCAIVRFGAGGVIWLCERHRLKAQRPTPRTHRETESGQIDGGETATTINKFLHLRWKHVSASNHKCGQNPESTKIC